MFQRANGFVYMNKCCNEHALRYGKLFRPVASYELFGPMDLHPRHVIIQAVTFNILATKTISTYLNQLPFLKFPEDS